MSVDIKVPVLPESVTDATIATWHKQPGESVSRDEHLVDIETDKVVLEVVAPADGTLSEIVHKTGETVKAQQVIARFEEGVVVQKEATREPKSEPKAEPQTEPKTEPKTESKPTSPLSPSARRALEEQGLEVAQVEGTGKKGRITKADIAALGITLSERTEKRVPMTRLRARIAERLLEAQHNAAILTTFNEVNMQPVIDMRAKYKDKFEQEHGVRLGFMSFFTMAVVEALKKIPAVNASIDGNDIIYHGYFDIGIAVSSPRGLVVPVLRDADTMTMAEMESNIREFSEKAKTGKLTMDELTGGTFTITNGGVFGSLLATPILNPPQSGILGMHKIEERPVVENGQIVIRPMMYVALSYDHRIIDGKESVTFLVAVKEALEDPARLLLDI